MYMMLKKRKFVHITESFQIVWACTVFPEAVFFFFFLPPTVPYIYKKLSVVLKIKLFLTQTHSFESQQEGNWKKRQGFSSNIFSSSQFEIFSSYLDLFYLRLGPHANLHTSVHPSRVHSFLGGNITFPQTPLLSARSRGLTIPRTNFLKQQAVRPLTVC